jgi:hypothetical protein
MGEQRHDAIQQAAFYLLIEEVENCDIKSG